MNTTPCRKAQRCLWACLLWYWNAGSPHRAALVRCPPSGGSGPWLLLCSSQPERHLHKSSVLKIITNKQVCHWKFQLNYNKIKKGIKLRKELRKLKRWRFNHMLPTQPIGLNRCHNLNVWLCSNLWGLDYDWHPQNTLPRQSNGQRYWGRVYKLNVGNALWPTRVSVWDHPHITNLKKST